jgi:type IV secretion system protein VirB9
MRPSPIVPLLLGLAATVAHGQQTTARLVKYHANDIVSVRAKMRYTTLIELPATEKILEVATGDKDFWIIDTVGNYCFLHPAKEGIHSNLNLITDKGSVYSFTLDDVESGDPDLKVVIEPSDPSSLAAANGAGKLVSANEVEAARAQVQAVQSQAAAVVEQFRADYPTQALKFDYSFHNEKPFEVSAIYHDDKFTYIKSSANEKFSIYELKDGKPDLITFQLRDGTRASRYGAAAALSSRRCGVEQLSRSRRHDSAARPFRLAVHLARLQTHLYPVQADTSVGAARHCRLHRCAETMHCRSVTSGPGVRPERHRKTCKVLITNELAKALHSI